MHGAGELSGPSDTEFDLQNSRTDSDITNLELHYVNHLSKVVQLQMTNKNRQPNSADVQIGASLRAHRLIAGMSQGELARKLGVSFQQIQKYEKGTNRVGAGRLPQIAKIFNIPISALFDVNANTSPGKSAGKIPIKLIPDRSTLKLLTAFGGIAHRKVRYSLVDLVNAIAKATPKTRR
jgi:transcriptional regulator with XRE-family HTH domain